MKLPANNFYLINVGEGGGGGGGGELRHCNMLPLHLDRIGCEVHSEPSGTAEDNFGLPCASLL